MKTQTDTSVLAITRFDTFEPTTGDNEGVTSIRLFAKRVKVAEIDEGDAREDYAETLPNFIAAKPRTAAEVLDFLGEEPGDEDEEGDEGGSIVPAKYRVRYGAKQRCGDDVAETLSAYVTLPRAGKKNDIDGGLDRAKLREVAEANGLGAKLTEYEIGGKDGEGLNGGLMRMNISNILRGMVRRGERVVIGQREWAEDVTNPKHPKAKAAAKLARDAAAAAKPAPAPKAETPKAAPAKTPRAKVAAKAKALNAK